MEFLYLGSFRFPDGDAAASRVLNNARIIKSLGHNIDVISFGGKYREKDKIGLGYEYEGIPYIITNDIDTHSWGERLRRYFLPPKNAWKILKKNIEKYDVIIVYNPSVNINYSVFKLCKKYQKKLILDLTEWPASNEFPGGKWMPFYWMSEWNMKIVQKKYKNIILISNYLSSYYKNANQLVLPPLINCNDKKWNREINNIPIEISAFKGKKIIFAGTPAKKDLLSNLLQATLSIVKEGKSIQVLIAGVNKNQSKNYIPNVEYEMYRENIIFLGRKPQEDIPGYYKLADFSAIIREPNRKNTAGFPTKMAESMASGCPVLLNTTSDLSAFVVDGNNAVVINDYTIDSIKRGLRIIDSLDNACVVTMKENSKKVAKNLFDYKQYIDKFENFLNHIK